MCGYFCLGVGWIRRTFEINSYQIKRNKARNVRSLTHRVNKDNKFERRVAPQRAKLKSSQSDTGRKFRGQLLSPSTPFITRARKSRIKSPANALVSTVCIPVLVLVGRVLRYHRVSFTNLCTRTLTAFVSLLVENLSSN